MSRETVEVIPAHKGPVIERAVVAYVKEITTVLLVTVSMAVALAAIIVWLS